MLIAVLTGYAYNSTLQHVSFNFSDYSKGFGGKFGVQQDRQDSSAGGYDEMGATDLHESQTDMKKGFGGKFGVQSSMDKVCVAIV